MLLLVCLSFLAPLSGAQALASVQNLLESQSVWTDEAAQSHTLQDWGAGPLVFTMVYGNCRKTCPNLTFVKLEEIQRELDSQKINAQFIIGTFDPENDTSQILKNLKVKFGNHPNWHFIRGGKKQTRELAHQLGLGGYYEMSPNDLDNHIVHKFRIVYFDPAAKKERALDYENKSVQALFSNQN